MLLTSSHLPELRSAARRPSVVVNVSGLQRFRGFGSFAPEFGGVHRRHISSSALSGTAKVKIPEVKGPLEAQVVAQSQSQTAAPAKDVLIKFKVPFKTSFGQVVKAVGEHKKLGEWTIKNAMGLTWTQGDNWVGELALPAGRYEFKIVVLDTASGSADWEQGSNRVLEVPGFPGTMEVPCIFNTPTMDITFIDAPVETIDPIELAAQAAAAEAAQAEAAAQAATADAAAATSNDDLKATAETTAKVAAAAEKVAAEAALKVETADDDAAKLAAARKSIQDTVVELMSSPEPSFPQEALLTSASPSPLDIPPAPATTTDNIITEATTTDNIITEATTPATPSPTPVSLDTPASDIVTASLSTVESITPPLEATSTPELVVSEPITTAAVVAPVLAADTDATPAVDADATTAPSSSSSLSAVNNVVPAPPGLAEPAADKSSKKSGTRKDKVVPVGAVADILGQEQAAKFEELVEEQAAKLANLAESPAGKLVNDFWDFLATGSRKKK